MNLFQEINKVEQLNSQITRLIKENDYRLIAGDKKWIIFDKDEQLVQVVINKKDFEEELILSTILFSDIGTSMEIFIRNIVCERKIREMAKQDQFGRNGYKIEMIRFIKLKGNPLSKDILARQLKSFTKKAKRIKEEVDSLLDYLMFVKLN